MPFIASDKGGSDFEPIPSGLHHAVCYAVIDIGTQPATGNFPSRRKVVFVWELPEERADFKKDGQQVNLPRAISQRFTASLASKGNLRPFLNSWRGRAFTEQELEGFDLFNAAGANCMLNIIHEPKGDKTYANISSITPLPKGMAKTTPENPILKFSIDEWSGTTDLPAMPDWIKKLVMQSDEYIKKAQQPGHTAHSEGNPSTLPEDSDSVPF